MPIQRQTPPINTDNVVTASELVRHFGIWQDRATRSPVYVLHRGRPRHVLTSIEAMKSLCAPQESSASGSLPAPEAILDLVDDMLILVNADLEIVAASHAARRFFGDAARQATGVERLSAIKGASSLRAAVGRVIATGNTEHIDLAGPYPGRRLGCAISPYPGGGAALHIQDASIADDLADSRSWNQAKRQAAIATGFALPARINLRGYIENVDATLADFLGVDAQMLASVRFVTLIELGSRVAVGDLIERVLSTGEAAAIDAQLLQGGAQPRPVRIGLAPIKRGAAIDGVAAILVVTEDFRQA